MKQVNERNWTQGTFPGQFELIVEDGQTSEGTAMKSKKLSKRLRMVGLAGSIALAILFANAASATAGGFHGFVGARAGSSMFVSHSFFAHRSFVRSPFAPVVVDRVVVDRRFVVDRVRVVSSTIVFNRSVVFISPSRFFFRRTFVATQFAPFVFHDPFVPATFVSSMAGVSPVVDPVTPMALTSVPVSASEVFTLSGPSSDPPHWVWNGSQWEWHTGSRIWVPRQWTWSGTEWVWAGGHWTR